MTEPLGIAVWAFWLGVFLWLTPSFVAVVTRKAARDDLWRALVWLFAVNRVTFNAIRMWVPEGTPIRQMIGDGWLMLSGLTAIVSVLVVRHYGRRG